MVVTVEQGASVTRTCDGCHSGARRRKVKRKATETHVLTPEIARPPSKTPLAAISGGPGKFLGFFLSTSSFEVIRHSTSQRKTLSAWRCVSLLTHCFLQTTISSLFPRSKLLVFSNMTRGHRTAI